MTKKSFREAWKIAFKKKKSKLKIRKKGVDNE